MALRFDEALPRLVGVLDELDLAAGFEDGRLIVLRDIIGVLTLVIRDTDLMGHRDEIAERLRLLRPYLDDGLPVASPDELFDDRLSDLEAGLPERVHSANGKDVMVRVVDRRLVGADWLRGPMNPIPDAPQVAVFWSPKGGVGRSTALSVAASALARSNQNVLAVDLDLEAPGIGAILVHEEDRPKFGAIDFFVEDSFEPADDSFLADMIAPSRLAVGGGGVIDVVPAIGAATDENPQNMLAKLARVYVDKSRACHDVSFLEQTRELVRRLSSRRQYDVVLVDARAGLNESTAAPVLGLGATVLLFGLNTPQTFVAYRYALAHLWRFVQVDNGRWRERLQMIHAKSSTPERGDGNGRQVSGVSGTGRKFVDRSFDLFAEFLYEEAEPGDTEAFNFDLDDPAAPHAPWIILDDSNYREFDPLAHPSQLDGRLVKATFGDFLGRLADRLSLDLGNGWSEP